MRGFALAAALIAALAGCRTYETTRDYCEGAACDRPSCNKVTQRCTLAVVDGSGGGGSGGGNGGATGGSDGGEPDATPPDAPPDVRECTDAATCGDIKPICSPTGSCVACTTADECINKDASRPMCAASGACVACLGQMNCRDVTPLCSPAGTCVPCSTPAAGTCADKDKYHPTCKMSDGSCVECVVDLDCMDATKPICSTSNVCTKCGEADPGACMRNHSMQPICLPSGACVACGVDSDCMTPPLLFCGANNACVSCGSAPAGATACSARFPAQPVCNSASGSCVTCLDNSNCPSTKPVCSGAPAYTCGPCAKDADCSGKAGPVVCMSHEDGRCATEGETIYVQAGGACSDAGQGSTGAPFCTMQPSVAAVSATRDLIILRGNIVGPASAYSGAAGKISIIGQMSAVVSPGLRFTGGSAFVRDLKIGPSGTTGIEADSGSTLRLDHVGLNRNDGGGIFVNGAAFSIKNTTVTNNGPGMSGATTWGGILINNPPAGGMMQLQLSTIQGNDPVGVSCMAAIAPTTDVLVIQNTSTQITNSCGFIPCMAASATCGAQP